jgi:hypothetical protein
VVVKPDSEVVSEQIWKSVSVQPLFEAGLEQHGDTDECFPRIVERNALHIFPNLKRCFSVSAHGVVEFSQIKLCRCGTKHAARMVARNLKAGSGV